MKTSKYIEIFTREAEEHLQLLRQGILALEKDGFARDLVHGLLRSAHTLKGSAKMLDLAALAEVSHHLEDLLKELEDGERESNPDLIDLLLVATDALEALIAQAHSGGEIEVNVDLVLQGLQSGRLPEFPAAVAATAAAPAAAEKKGAADTVRASVARLDQLINHLGELLITRRMFDERCRQIDELRRRLELFFGQLRRQENLQAAKTILTDFSRLSLALEQDTLQLGYLSEEVHAQAMELRMLPLSTVTDDLQRAVRSLARDQGKQIELSIRGSEVELDRLMLDAVKPMLLHMLRNAVDHGIETPEERRRTGKPPAGRIELAARYEGGTVRVSLSDDGRGIDPARVRQVARERGLLGAAEDATLSDDEALYLILRPGFSTRDYITDISGRGVGMDVVKTKLDQVKGDLSIHSAVGRGTEMVLHFPLTLAVMPSLIVECEQETYALPLHNVSEVVRLGESDILSEGGREVVRVRGATLPLLSLREILGLPARAAGAGQRVTAVVLHLREQRIACLVTRSLGTQELVVKSLGRQLRRLDYISGASILGDGSPALILSVPELFAAGHAGAQLRRQFSAEREKRQKGRILVVDDSITTRTMEKNILETQGYAVTVAVSGEAALAMVAEADFDLVVSDVEMPGINGFELTRRLRQMERTSEVPVIIVTSLASDEHRRLGIEVGAQAYIVKGSFDQGTLLQTVETLIG